MKITFSNLGAIKKTTLDLRPLTVIIGPNNSNKTYIAYSVYGLLKEINSIITASLLTSIGYEFPIENPLVTVDRLYKIGDDKSYLLNINSNLLKSFTEDSRILTHKFKQQLEVFFQDTSKNLFRKTDFEINLSLKELKSALIKLIGSEVFTTSENVKYTLNKSSFLAKIKGNNNFFREVSLEHYVASSIIFELKSSLYPRPFILPAERNALTFTYKILEKRRFDLLKDTNRNLYLNNNLRIKNPPTLFGSKIKSSQQDVNYPQPIEDFLDFLTNLSLEKVLEKGKFSNLADYIETNLQQNNKTNYISTELGGKEIKIHVKKGLDIDLYNASSSIKQLAPFLLYLRYQARENDLLIIDEPEMNLHPESQAKLLEVLAMLVNAGVNVLLTTHSPYFMSHLNNLISGDMTDAIREKQAKSLYLEDERAFLKPEDVSAYEMQQNKKGEQSLHNLYDEDYGIRWDTLSDVSGVIQQKYFEIYEKGKKSSDGEEES